MKSVNKNDISGLTEVCFRCNSIESLTENQNGDLICESCLSEVCERCEHGEPEVEARNEYVCVDCYSGDIDDAYERARENSWE
jgi:hypothetical protein